MSGGPAARSSGLSGGQVAHRDLGRLRHTVDTTGPARAKIACCSALRCPLERTLRTTEPVPARRM